MLAPPTFPPVRHPSPLHGDVRMLIAVRVVVVTTLLLAALLIQFTSDLVLPIDYIYATTAITYALTIVYIVLAAKVRSRTVNLYVQTAGDLLIETILVYFTGGLDSPFSFLYLVSIITASMLLYRRGGLLAASGAVILYGGLADLMYYGILPPPPQNLFSPTPWSSLRLYLNIATNFAGFYATALLTSYLSEKLRTTFRELDVNRENLAQLQALNQNVVESVPSGLVTMTMDGILSFINPAAREILGIDVARARGNHITETGLFGVEEWRAIRERIPIDHMIRAETGFERDGEPRRLGYAITPLNTLDGRSYGLTLIFQDLTEVKKLEAQLQLKDRMAAVGELSAGIAHEIRNPLAAIAGSVQVLQGSKSFSQQEQRLMSIILRESERLDKSISDFLRFVKPQERQLLEFDIAASLDETIELLLHSPDITEKHSVERLIDPPSFRMVGDPDQMRQVFWNIARNAFQAMPAAGRLRVSTSADAASYRIVFADDGAGMTERQQKSLFQPFRTGFPAGTGLGMAISYRIVQEHGGRIEVDSRPGEGTAIALVLPVQQERGDESGE